MSIRTYQATGALLRACELTLPFRIHQSGVENLVDRPTMFVVNHFTRFETLVVPYVLYQITGRQVRTLANHRLFHGILDRYLRACAVMPTNEPNRNDTIVGELMTGTINWVIYPEGGLVKSKRVVEGRRLMLDLPHRTGPPRTGAAVMALSAEIYKRRYLHALDEGNHERAKAIATRFNFEEVDDLCHESVVITPVTVTYHPLSSDRTKLYSLIEKLGRITNDKVLEELRVETSLLMNKTEIGVHFNAPIEVRDFLDRSLEPLWRLARRARRVDDDPALKSRARRLTQRFMRSMYENVEVGIEHLFCAALRCAGEERISRTDLHAAIYLAGREILDAPSVRTHGSLEPDLESIVITSDPKPLRRVVALAESEGVLQRDGDEYVVNVEALSDRHLGFHEVRLLGMTCVIANELDPAPEAMSIVRHAVKQAESKRRDAVADTLYEGERDLYDRAYDHWHTPGVSRPREVGQPFILNGKRSGLGVVLVHGYLACPQEMETVAKALHEREINVYVARLAGHGTAPEHLEHVRWEDWMASLRRSFGAMKHQCDRVVVGGFSLGGVMALNLASEGDPALAGVFTVNAPMKLRDRRAVFARSIVGWNRMKRFLHITDARATRPNKGSESPDINYMTNHLRGVVELRRAIRASRRRLSGVTVPVLVIQALEDPVVDPTSGRLILEGISSVDREELMVPEDRHVIVRGDLPDQLIERICDFSERVCETTGARRARRIAWFWPRHLKTETHDQTKS